MYLNLCHISLDGLRLSVKVVFPLRGVNLEIIYIYIYCIVFRILKQDKITELVYHHTTVYIYVTIIT